MKLKEKDSNKIKLLFCFLFLPMICWPQSHFWAGDGGKDLRITISEPTGDGLSEQEEAMLPLIQSTIIGVFQKYSAIVVFDRQNLENILKEQRISLSGYFSDKDYIRIGNLTNARLIVFGALRKIANTYWLELAITDVETGERKASYIPRQVSLQSLEDLSAIRMASADLLGQLGVTLTESGIKELQTVENITKIRAENALAKGIAAQRQGTVVEALMYYFQAIDFDPSLEEAVNRVSIVSSNIASGNLGESIRTRLQQHDEWRTIANTANLFYSNHFPYEFVYNTNIQRDSIDFERRTVDLSIEVSLKPTDAWKTINDLRQGLDKTRGNDKWNFSFSQVGPDQIIVILKIINENKVALATGTHTFFVRDQNETSEENTTGIARPLSSVRLIPARNHENNTLKFQNVKADDITDRLTVQVVSINGISAEEAGKIGLIQISTLKEYNIRMMPQRAREEEVRRKRGEATTAAQIKADARRPLRQPLNSDIISPFAYINISIGANSNFSEKKTIQVLGNFDFFLFGIGVYYPFSSSVLFSFPFTIGRKLLFSPGFGILGISSEKNPNLVWIFRLKATYLIGSYITGNYERQSGWGPYIEYLFPVFPDFYFRENVPMSERPHYLSVGVSYFHQKF